MEFSSLHLSFLTAACKYDYNTQLHTFFFELSFLPLKMYLNFSTHWILDSQKEVFYKNIINITITTTVLVHCTFSDECIIFSIIIITYY